MGWREAFLTQARSDHEVFMRLNTPEVPYCHRLHYFQMATEKLSKALSVKPQSSQAPRISHAALVAMLQSLKSQRAVQRRLGYSKASIFSAYIDSLLDIASQVEKLAPNFAGLSRPNPEYPWEDQGTKEIVAPSVYEFPEISPGNSKVAQLQRLISSLLKIVE